MAYRDITLTYGLLMLAIIALWFPARHVEFNGIRYWTALFIASLSAGIAAGFIDPVAVLPIVGLGLACYLWTNSSHRVVKGSAGVLIVVVAISFMAHLVPGFHNPQAISERVLSAKGIAYTQEWNFDKALVGLFLLAFCHPLLRTKAQWLAMLRVAVPVAALVIGIVIIVALAMGYVQLDIKLTSLFVRWALINLFFTCVAEEAFFRGFVQKTLQSSLATFSYGGIVALITTSILFGLAHFAGGPNYILLATLAGLGYGWVYQQTSSIEASILTHFSLNAVHFLFFTYPALAQASSN